MRGAEAVIGYDARAVSRREQFEDYLLLPPQSWTGPEFDAPVVDYYRCHSRLQLSIRQANLDGSAGSRAIGQLNLQRQNWLSQFPNTAAELWPWCLAQTQERLLELLGFCVTATVDAVVLPHRESFDVVKVEHANQLAVALQMDMRSWFTPSVENFFGRISKVQIGNALAEAEHPLGPQETKIKRAS